MLLHQKSCIFKTIKIDNRTKNKNKLTKVERGFRISEPIFSFSKHRSIAKSGNRINRLVELCR